MRESRAFTLRALQTRTGDILGISLFGGVLDLNARKYMLKNVSTSVAATGSGLPVMASGAKSPVTTTRWQNCCNSHALPLIHLKSPHQEPTTRMAATIVRRQSAPARWRILSCCNAWTTASAIIR